jgi:hypothetical protein
MLAQIWGIEDFAITLLKLKDVYHTLSIATLIFKVLFTVLWLK